MNVPTLEVEQPFAAERYAEYLRATNRTTEDEQCKRVYRAIARGNRVVNLCEAMRLAGTDHLYRPRLAIARASNLQQSVAFTWEAGPNGADVPIFGDITSARSYHDGWEEGVFYSRIVLPPVTFPCHEERLLGQTVDGRNIRSINASVPIIPPAMRPKQPQAYHILWEVDEWAAGRTTPEHSRDPLLLKHLGSWFFVIVAEWDLTDVERQVYRLSMRR